MRQDWSAASNGTGAEAWSFVPDTVNLTDMIREVDACLLPTKVRLRRERRLRQERGACGDDQVREDEEEMDSMERDWWAEEDEEDEEEEADENKEEEGGREREEEESRRVQGAAGEENVSKGDVGKCGVEKEQPDPGFFVGETCMFDVVSWDDVLHKTQPRKTRPPEGGGADEGGIPLFQCTPRTSFHPHALTMLASPAHAHTVLPSIHPTMHTPCFLPCLPMHSPCVFPPHALIMLPFPPNARTVLVPLPFRWPPHC